MDALRGFFVSPPPPQQATDDYWLPFVEKHLPHTFRLLKDSSNSRFFKLINHSFGLLHDLQFHCLTFNYRAIGIHHFMVSQKEQQRSEMEENYKEWVEKENRYLLEAGYDFDKLSVDQKSLVQAMRKTIFQLIHDEQQSLKKQDPFLPFLSIWNSQGKKNSLYKFAWMSYQMEKFRESNKAQKGKSKEFIDKVESTFKEQLAEKKWAYETLTRPEQLLADAAKESAYQALLKVLYNDTDDLSEDHSHLYNTALSYEKGSNIKYWENLEKVREEARIEKLFNEKWVEYSKKEQTFFLKAYGYPLNSLLKEMQELAKIIKIITLRVIHEEQYKIKIIYEEQHTNGEPGSFLPFVSIYNHEGDLNEDYWIDLIDAKTKIKRERLPGEKVFLKDCCDYDIVRTQNAPPEEKGLISTTNLRKNGAITPDFCSNALNHLSEVYKITKQKLKLTSSVSELEQLQAIFKNNTQSKEKQIPTLSREEQILCFQNEFCDVLSTLYFIQGDSASLLKRLGIIYKASSPRLLFLPSNPSNDAEKMRDSFPEITSMEEECEALKSWMEQERRVSIKQSARSAGKKGPEEIDHDLKELITERLIAYSVNLKTLGELLERLGNILHYFSESLVQIPQNEIQTVRRKRNVSMDFVLTSPRPGKGPSRIYNLKKSETADGEGLETIIEAKKKSTPEKNAEKVPKLLLRQRTTSDIQSHSYGEKSSNETQVLRNRASSTDVRSNSPREKWTQESPISPRITDSPRISEMSPARFKTSGDLCLRIQKIIKDVASIITNESNILLDTYKK